MIRAFRSTLEDLEERRSVHSLHSLRSSRSNTGLQTGQQQMQQSSHLLLPGHRQQQQHQQQQLSTSLPCDITYIDDDSQITARSANPNINYNEDLTKPVQETRI